MRWDAVARTRRAQSVLGVERYLKRRIFTAEVAESTEIERGNNSI